MQLLQTGCPRLSIEIDESAINAASEAKLKMELNLQQQIKFQLRNNLTTSN